MNKLFLSIILVVIAILPVNTDANPNRQKLTICTFHGVVYEEIPYGQTCNAYPPLEYMLAGNPTHTESKLEPHNPECFDSYVSFVEPL